MESLLNKVILITGASTGIGGFTAKYLSKYKPKLALVARSKDRLKQVQQLCEQGGCGKGDVLSVTADLSKQKDLSRVVSETVTAFGRLDVLVNNAAAITYNDLETTTPETFDHTMAVNIRAPFFLSQAAIPHLKKTKGCIVNISSTGSERGVVEFSAHCISKAALDHLTRVLAFEVAQKGVRVNSVNAGFTWTDTMERTYRQKMNEMTWLATPMEKVQPLGGACTMEDIAKVVAFLCCDLSAAMTGVCVPVDRGSLIVPAFTPDSLGISAGFRNMVAFDVDANQNGLDPVAGAKPKGGKPPTKQ